MTAPRYPGRAFVLIVVGALGFWWMCIIDPPTGEPFITNLVNVDFFTQIYPMSLRAAAWIREGSWPLWNPFQLAGHPFLATALYGVCYPLNALYLFLPTPVAIEAVVLLHLVLAGWFVYLYATEVGLHPIAGLAGAAAYMLSGFMATQASWFTPAIASSVWLPLALLGVERVVARADLRSTAIVALAVAMALLGGWTQFWMYTMYVIGLYAGVHTCVLLASPATRARVPRIAVLLVLAVGLGMALTAVQLLPTMELQSLGPRRPGGLSMDQLVPWGSMAPERLLAQSLDWRTTDRFIDGFYLGPVLVPLVFFSLCARGHWVRLVPLWMTFVAAGLVTVALYTPFFEHVYLHLPAARLFRIPQRIVFLYAMSAALLAAYGADALLATPARRVGRLSLGFVVAVVLGAMLAQHHPVPRGGFALLAATVALIVVATTARTGGLRMAAAVGLVALLVGDHVHSSTNRYRHPYHGLEILHRQDVILDYVHAHQGLYRTYTQDPFGLDFSVMPKMGTLREIYAVTDYEPLGSMRFAELFETFAIPRAKNVPFTGWFNLDPASPSRHLLQLLSVKYMVVHEATTALTEALAQPGSFWRLVPVDAPGPYRLYEHMLPLARAYVATHADVVADAAASLQTLRAPGFDVRSGVVVERGAGLPEALPGSAAAPVPIVPARVVRYEPREVVVEADAAASGYLVLTDSFYPGWDATVDGVAAPIYAANHVVRAVPIGPGHHVVVFRYEPKSVRTGAWISALALVGLIAAVVVGRPRV